jgi:hypothetical protein
MISIEEYSVFLTKIKSLDSDVQAKLESILNKRLEGVLPKENMFSHEQENKYDYTYKLEEDLIPFLDKFDEYFYPQKLIDDKIINQINVLVSELQQITLITQQLNDNSFKDISQIMLFASKMGDTIFHTYKKIEDLLLIHKKDVLIDNLLKHIEYIDLKSINFILENNNGIYHFMDKIKYKVNEIVQEIVIKNNYKVSFNYCKLIRNVEKKLSIIQWYIFSNEMKFLDKINIFNFKIQNLFMNKISVYENKFMGKKTVELENGNIFEENINLLEEYQNNSKKIEFIIIIRLID